MLITLSWIYGLMFCTFVHRSRWRRRGKETKEMRTVTIWENDMTDEIDTKTLGFVRNKFKGYEVKQLSALSHRDRLDILDSLRDSYAIVIQPNMLEIPQIQQIAKLISHPLHGNKHSNMREWDIQSFVFVDNHPWETLNAVRSALVDVKDSVNELCLMKILGACDVEFFNFDLSVHYELVTDGYWNTKAIRYK